MSNTHVLHSSFRPVCINPGCGKPVAAMKGRIGDTNVRWRVYCSVCHEANYKRLPLRKGVTPFRTHTCSNVDGHLGWTCFTDLTKAPDYAKGLTEIDHIDGNHTNNEFSNLQELCQACHKIKSSINGDTNNNRITRH